MRMKLDDSALRTTIFSPVCTYCAYWKPSDNRHCDAYPRGNTPREKTPQIPTPIWDGIVTHVFPYGGEARDANGKPILFKTHPAVKKLPAKIAADLKQRAAQQQAENKKQP